MVVKKTTPCNCSEIDRKKFNFDDFVKNRKSMVIPVCEKKRFRSALAYFMRKNSMVGYEPFFKESTNGKNYRVSLVLSDPNGSNGGDNRRNNKGKTRIYPVAEMLEKNQAIIVPLNKFDSALVSVNNYLRNNNLDNYRVETFTTDKTGLNKTIRLKKLPDGVIRKAGRQIKYKLSTLIDAAGNITGNHIIVNGHEKASAYNCLMSRLRKINPEYSLNFSLSENSAEFKVSISTKCIRNNAPFEVKLVNA